MTRPSYDALPAQPGRPDGATPIETTQVAGKVYAIDALRTYAEQLPIDEVPLEELRSTIGPADHYWVGRDGKWFGPHDMLVDWEAAQANDAWSEHVETIKRADVSNPIWQMRGGLVFDGVHRLTRAMLDHAATIRVRTFDALPASAEVKEDSTDD